MSASSLEITNFSKQHIRCTRVTWPSDAGYPKEPLSGASGLHSLNTKQYNKRKLEKSLFRRVVVGACGAFAAEQALDNRAAALRSNRLHEPLRGGICVTDGTDACIGSDSTAETGIGP